MRVANFLDRLMALLIVIALCFLIPALNADQPCTCLPNTDACGGTSTECAQYFDGGKCNTWDQTSAGVCQGHKQLIGGVAPPADSCFTFKSDTNNTKKKCVEVLNGGVQVLVDCVQFYPCKWQVTNQGGNCNKGNASVCQAHYYSIVPC